MRLGKLLSCLLIGAVLASIPQGILSYAPTDSFTLTATLTPITTITLNGLQGYCGVGVAVIPPPFTGMIHIDFHSSYAPLDIYILPAAQLADPLFIYPCGTHPTSGQCPLIGCVFAQAGVFNEKFDVNLPSSSGSMQFYAILLVQCCLSVVNGSTATIVINGNSVESVSLTSYTPEWTTYTPHTYSTTSNAVTTFAYFPTTATSPPSLQMPQPPQPMATQSTNAPQLVLAIVAVAVVLIGAVFLYSQRKPKVTSAEKLDTPLSTKTEGKRLCVKCGNELSPNLKFCDSCGTKQS